MARPSSEALAGALICALLACAPLGAQEAGERPAYNTRALSAVPNEKAIVRRFWMPGLEAGYTPQGLVHADGQVHVVGYGPGGCRLFSLSTSGAVQRAVVLPGCRHGGGLAALGPGRLVVIDTHALFIVSGGKVTRSIALAPPLSGALGDFDGKALWIGAYVRGAPGTLWRIDPARLDQETLGEGDVSAKTAIPEKAQGLAFHRGEMWLSFSGGNFGRLSRHEAGTGREIARYDAPAGIEDLGSDGKLIWAVSEAGARKYAHWATNFPLVFAIDPARLK